MWRIDTDTSSKYTLYRVREIACLATRNSARTTFPSRNVLNAKVFMLCFELMEGVASKP